MMNQNSYKCAWQENHSTGQMQFENFTGKNKIRPAQRTKLAVFWKQYGLGTSNFVYFCKWQSCCQNLRALVLLLIFVSPGQTICSDHDKYDTPLRN